MSNERQPWGIRLACPVQYNIEATPEIRARVGYSNIEEWWWYRLTELHEFAMRAHDEAVRRFGKPKQVPFWLECEGGDVGQIKRVSDLFLCFGRLMDGNKWELRNSPVYTYVSFCHGAIPRTADFSLQKGGVPEERTCSNGWVYVPAGWGNEVLKLIRLRVWEVVFGKLLHNLKYKKWEPVSS